MISNRNRSVTVKNCPNAGVRDVDTDGSFLDLADQETGVLGVQGSDEMPVANHDVTRPLQEDIDVCFRQCFRATTRRIPGLGHW